ncbi:MULTISPECIES: hypothetical protein [unclassified Sphingobium]|jgi:RES domain-containing protein|uniref:hypothetical protein n=1 Tax=unclassified Sphingobium TaxID=2611147 RepID=UPI0034342BCA
MKSARWNSGGIKGLKCGLTSAISDEKSCRLAASPEKSRNVSYELQQDLVALADEQGGIG